MTKFNELWAILNMLVIRVQIIRRSQENPLVMKKNHYGSIEKSSDPYRTEFYIIYTKQI